MGDILWQPGGEIEARRPVRHAKAEWPKHKALLLQLYLAENKTAKEVQQHMRKHWHFDARQVFRDTVEDQWQLMAYSLQQYQRQFKKWSVEKNKPQERWNRLPRLLKRKHVDVDHAEIWDGGVVQDRKRVKKYLSRNNLPTLGQKYGLRASLSSSRGDLTAGTPTGSCTSDDIFVRVALTPRLELSTPTTLPWFEFVRSCHLSFPRGSVARGQPAPGPSHGVIYDLETPANPEIVPLTELANLSSTQGAIEDRYIQDSQSLKCATPSLADAQKLCSQSQQSSNSEMDSKILIEAAMPAEIPGDIHVDPMALLRASTSNGVATGMTCHFYILYNILWDKINLKLDLDPILEIPGLLRFILKSPEPPAKALTQHLVKVAIDLSDHTLLKILRSYGVDFNRPIPDPIKGPLTPIQYFMDTSRLTTTGARVLDFLLESGADPDHCWRHEASERLNQSACCEMLPIMRATSDHYDGTIIDMLVAAGCTIPDDVDITSAISADVSIDTLEALLEHTLIQSSWSSTLADYLYPLQAAVANSNEELVEVVLEHGECPSGRADAEIDYHLDLQDHVFVAYDYNMKDLVNLLRSPLASALLDYDSEIVELLLGAGADVNHCHASAIEPYLELDGISPLPTFDDRRASTHTLVLTAVQAAVYTAVYMDDLTRVETILQRWVPAHSCHGTPPLVLGVLSGNRALVELLLRHGADVCEVEDGEALHTPERRRFSALGAAAALGSISLMEVLIEAGADVNQPASGPGVLSPLQAAVYFRQHDSILHLCQAGVDVSLPGAEEDGLSAIEAAIHVEDFWAFEFLCQQCIPTQRSMVLAAKLEDERFLDKLIGMGCNVDDPDVVEASVSEGGRFFQLLDAGLQLAMPIQNKTFADVAYMAAVKVGNIRILHSIFDNGHTVCEETVINSCEEGLIKDPEWLDLYARSFVAAKPSHEATSEVPSIAILLQHLHLNPEYPERCATALYGAIQALLVNGSDVNAHYNNKTPLQSAIDSGQFSVGQLLIDNGASVNLRPSNARKTALQSACFQGNTAMVSLLLKSGADTNATGSDFGGQFAGPTALQIACKMGHVDINCMLVHHGARINAPASDLALGRTALQAACQGGYVEIVNLLINNHADVNAPAGPNRGVTALQAAAIEGFFRIVQILVAASADVAAPASAYEGRTAIDGAAERGRLDITHYLLDHYEGDESISTICDRARTYAWKEGHMGVVHLLDTYQRHPA